MSFEEEFDRTMREKAEGAKFPFSEENWLKASQLIDADRIANPVVSNKKYLVYGAISALITGIVLMGYWLSEDTQVLGVQTLASTKTDAIEITNKIVNTQNTDVVRKTTGSVNSEVQTVQNLNLEKPKVNETNPAEKLSLSAAVFTNTGDNTEPPVSGNNNSTASGQNDPSKSNIVSKGVIPNIEREEIKPDDVNEQNEKELNESNSVGSVESILKIELLPTIPVVYAGIIDDPELIPQGPSLHKIWDEDYYKKGTPITSHYMDVELGGMYLLGWQNQGTQDAKGLNGFAGINYGFYFNKKFSLGTGIQMYSVQHINQPFYTNTQMEYGFGATQSQTVITCNTLLFAAIPLKLYYSIDQDNLIGLGVNAGYLVSANNTVETYKISDNQKTPASTPKTGLGIYEGMSTVNMMLTGSVLKRLNSKWAIQAEFNYGLSDLFTNTSSNNSKQNSSGIRVGLNYRLFSN